MKMVPKLLNIMRGILTGKFVFQVYLKNTGVPQETNKQANKQNQWSNLCRKEPEKEQSQSKVRSKEIIRAEANEIETKRKIEKISET